MAKQSWAHDIYRHIIAMLSLLVIFIIIAATYGTWHQSTSRDLEQRLNHYHLESSSYYLKASNELRHIQTHLSGFNHTAAPHSHTTNQQHLSLANSIHLINREIGHALSLQNKFGDPRFTQMSKTIQQHKQFLTGLTASQDSSSTQKKITTHIPLILNSLTQLTLLHDVSRDKLITEFKQNEHNNSLVFYCMLTTLLACGLYISWRGLRSIQTIISAQQQSEERIQHQANYDALTDLPNRFLLIDRLNQLILDAQRQQEYIAVLFLDVDHFKRVNDSLGHEAGDQLLVEVANRLTCAVRDGDSVGRLGGDEFVILLSHFSQLTNISPIIDKIFQQLQTPLAIEGRDITMTASIGISVYPDDGQNSAELLRNADSAMYHSKSDGRNTYTYFTENMNHSTVRKIALEQQMLAALERHEFEVYYQPQVDLRNGHIIGAEALLRWNNETLNNPTPDEFIPIAEQTGMIIPIGQYVLQQALQACSHWQINYFPSFRIAINLSPQQFRDPNLVETIASEIERHDISFSSVELEITEGVLLSGIKDIKPALQTLSELGIILSMDDFGTGYSSLSYLRSYPFSIIKIDRSFIRDLFLDPKDYELIKAAISLAHNLQLKVIAEGVEENSQQHSLHQLHCDYAQGYLFGKPMSRNNLEQLIKQRAGDQNSNNHFSSELTVSRSFYQDS